MDYYLDYSLDAYKIWEPLSCRIVTARGVSFVRMEIEGMPVIVDQHISISSNPISEDDKDSSSNCDDSASSANDYYSFINNVGTKFDRESGEGGYVEITDDMNETRQQRNRALPAWHE